MGTWLGHATTGSFFFAVGLFLFVRSLGLSYLRPLRERGFWIILPAWLQLLGGIIYTIGEIYFASHWAMSTTQHVLMSSTFMLQSIVRILHMNQTLPTIGWSLFYPLGWIIIAILFYFHPQASPYLEFGHDSMAVLFTTLCIVQIAELLIGHYTLPLKAIFRPPVQTYGFFSTIEANFNPLYFNTRVYGTPLPMMSGFILMLAGTWDWDMAMKFANERDPKLTMMLAMEVFLMHMLANTVFSILVCIVLQKFDSRRLTSIGDDELYFASVDGKANTLEHGVDA